MSKTPKTDAQEKTHYVTGMKWVESDFVRELEISLTSEREAKAEYLRRDAERNRQLVAEREARMKAERERDTYAHQVDAQCGFMANIADTLRVRGQAGEVKEEREELGEAWEQLAHNFPAIQVDCENTIQAAQFVNSEWERSQSELTQLRQDAKRLREASQAVVDRWETPLWKDVPHTATFIHALHDALSAMQLSEEPEA